MSDMRDKSIASDLYKSEIPFLAVSNQIHIEMFSNRQISIDGTFSVTEYTDLLISLKLKKGSLVIIGSELSILSVNEERIVIVGNILNLSFDKSVAK